MRRIVILGPPGSGKSTLARQLGTQLGVPAFHLDQAFWQPGWVETPAAAFRAEVERIAALPGWVIDGNYVATLAPRLLRAELALYLDVPAWVTLPRILRRLAASYGQVRPDSAPGCVERPDWAFLRFAWTWSRLRRARTLAMLRDSGVPSLTLDRRATAATVLDAALPGWRQGGRDGDVGLSTTETRAGSGRSQGATPS